MNKSIDVSVIVPVYNVEKYIEKTIQSILRQSFQSIELILVNDGTQDMSIQKATKILRDTKIQYQIINQTNQGLPVARNVGIKSANGQYICFIDGDDIIAPDHVENLYTVLKKNKLNFAFSEFELVGMNNREGKTTEKECVSEILEKEILRKKFLNRKIKIHCCAIMLKKSFMEKNNLMFDSRLRFGEDVEFLWRLLDCISEAGYIKNKTYKYLVRENSLMTNQNVDRIKVFRSVFQNSVSQLKDMSDEQKTAIIERVNFGIIHSFAKNSSYEMLLELLHISEKKSLKSVIRNIRDFKIIVLIAVLYISPKSFWRISQVV